MFATVPCCDDCWWDVDENNVPTAHGRGFFEGAWRLPHRTTQEHRELEHCHFCGWTTYSGIWVRVNTPAAERKHRHGSGNPGPEGSA